MWSLRITFKGGNWYWHYSYLWGEETEPEQSEESQVHTSVEIGVNPGIPLKRDGWVSESGVVTGKNAKWRVVLRKVALTQSARTSWERTWIPFLLHLQLWNLTTSWIKLSSFIRHHSCNDVTSPRNKKDIMGFGPQITYWMNTKKKKKETMVFLLFCKYLPNNLGRHRGYTIVWTFVPVSSLELPD